MAILVNAHEISKSFTTRPLFSEITFSIESGERVGLIGPNGAGKSTLLKILAGKLMPDEGTLSVQRGLRVGYLEQVPTFSPGATIESAIYESLRDPHDWQEISKAQEMMSKLSLSDSAKTPPTTLINDLSGGWKKRVALTRELLREPDLLLLDEPTNHLDVESILWLEEFLAHAAFGTITITHDRLFLQRVSNRIIELDRRHPDGLLSINGDYAKYLEVREQLMSAQEQQEVKLRNTLRRETEWLRRGAKARQTKQQARIKNAGHLKDEVEELRERNQTSSVRIDFQNAEKNPKRLIEAQEITKSYGDKLVIPKISLKLTPKSRIGLLGSNGSGKSTLIRLLLNQEKPDTGSVIHADQLQVAYFEQNRESLDPNISLEKTVCSGGDHVDFRGTKVHVKSYLSRFLFRHEQMGLPVGKLSGGEQSRLLIARLMLKHANVLVLDEPTNDLDITTLDVLADVLEDFNGGVILVSHDRYFLDHVANQILAFGYDQHGHKKIETFADLEQWEAWHEEQSRLLQDFKKKGLNLASLNTRPAMTTANSNATSAGTVSPIANDPKKKKKLSYKDQREYDGIELAIKLAEEQLAKLTHESTKPEYASNASKLTEISSQMAAAQTEVDRLYARWAQLED